MKATQHVSARKARSFNTTSVKENISLTHPAAKTHIEQEETGDNVNTFDF
jgi:hypothetical protein